MQVTRLRPTVAAIVVAAGLTVASAAGAVAGTSVTSGNGPLRVSVDQPQPGARAGAGGAAHRPAARTQPSWPTTVTLLTGDRVRVSQPPGGQPSITPEPAVGARPSPSTFVRFSSDGDQYVVPDSAVPYLRSTLDPRLFDVSYLARAKLTATPVRITYTSARATANLPGVRVTHRSGTTASATITPARAAQLGNTLATQWRSARAGRSTAAAGRLPGITRIELVRAPGAPPLPSAPAQKAQRAQGSGLPFYTLTLKFTGLNGKPGVGIGFVQNVNDASLALDLLGAGGGTPAGALQGPISVSVPRGTYSLMFTVLTPHAADSGFDTALVVKPEMTVSSDRTVTLDARTAVPFSSSVRSVKAPARVDVLDFARASVSGGGSDTTAAFGDLTMGLLSVTPGTLFPGQLPSRLLATPTAAAKTGVFGFDASTRLYPSVDAFEGAATGRPTYLLDFPAANRIPASLHYAVPADRLTAVHEQVYGVPADSCPTALTTNVFHPWGTDEEFNFPVPAGSRTDYWYTSAPRLSTFQPRLSASDCTGRSGARQRIRQGGQVSEVWNKAPLVPSPASPFVNQNSVALAASDVVTDPALVACTACREDNNAVLFLTPLGDSDRSHLGTETLDPTSATFGSGLRFYRNGTLSFDSSPYGGASPFGFDLPLLPRAATYRLDWTQATGSAAASNTTDWTFHSSSTDAPAKLPSTAQCAPDPTRACSFLPLLFINYDLALNFSNQATAGTSEAINFTVGGQQTAPAPAGVTATVSASFDDGKTWTSPVRAASLGHDEFTARIKQPALANTSGFVSLRVHAKDAAGSAVDQTIIRAYGLAG